MSSTFSATAFQPTLPARGATYSAVLACYQWVISTHAPRTGSDAQASGDTAKAQISTHAPRTGSDAPPMTSVSPPSVFQPTLPARGATDAGRLQRFYSLAISTHAPRTGSDVFLLSDF